MRGHTTAAAADLLTAATVTHLFPLSTTTAAALATAAAAAIAMRQPYEFGVIGYNFSGFCNCSSLPLSFYSPGS